MTQSKLIFVVIMNEMSIVAYETRDQARKKIEEMTKEWRGDDKMLKYYITTLKYYPKDSGTK